MKTYYTTENGKITASAGWKLAPDALETDVPIVRGYDGQLYLEGEAPIKPLELVKEEKLAEISAAYHEYDSKGIVMTSMGFPLQVGQEHCTKLDGAIRFAEMVNQPEIYVTDADNVTHYNITLAGAKQLLSEQMAAAMAAHARKQALRELVIAADSAAAVEAVVW